MHNWHDSQDYKVCKTLKWERTSVNANINYRAESLVACTLKYYRVINEIFYHNFW